MVSDTITITSTGAGIAEALNETERTAAYKQLSHKQTLRLCLLAEELTGMVRSIVGHTEAQFWVEAEGDLFSLHLSTKTQLSPDVREALLKASTSGKNAAKRGFMGKLWDVILRMSEPGVPTPSAYDSGYIYTDPGGFDTTMGVGLHTVMAGWSLDTYRQSLEQQGKQESEDWDELEKSIVAKLADEVKVFIRGDAVEAVIEKRFPPQ